MPGPYAHMTLVRVLRSRLAAEEFPELEREARQAVARSTAYCCLGAIAPDCSYFAIGEPDHTRWGDLIHERGAMRVLVAAARAIRGEADPGRRRHGFAWALGFASHVAADAVVHPVVNAIAGDYYASAENARRHKECEIHQDTYIYQRLGLHEIGRADAMRELAAACSDPQGRLDPWLAGLWGRCLAEVYGAAAPREPADPGRWFRGFCALIDVADEGHHFSFRQVLAEKGLMYVVPRDIDPEFVSTLWTPAGRQSYEQVFERAVRATAALWIDVARAIAGDEAGLVARPDVNLNEGTADAVPVFWSAR